MNKRDWIILRLLKEGAGTPAAHKPDHMRAVLYLIKKHGPKAVCQAIDQLKAGEKS